MKNLVLKLRENKDLYNTVVVGVGSIFASVFSYLLQLFLGRTLSVEDFGSFTVLLSLSTYIGIPATVFGVSLIKTVSSLFSKNDYSKLTKLFWELVKLAVYVGIIIFGIIFIFRNVISTELQIYDVSAVSLFSFMTFFAFLSSIPNSYLQGLQKFKKYAFFQVITGFNRFLFPVLLVSLGVGLQGVYGGFIFSTLITLCIGILIVKKYLVPVSDEDVSGEISNIIKFSNPVFFVTFCMLSLNNIDIILVKKFFDPELAGYYAGTVTLGKILLFGAGVVTTVMYPQVAALHTRGENYTKRFKQLFSLQALIVIAGVLVYTFIPELLATLFFGNRFIGSIEYLPLFSVFIGLYVLINFLTMFALAIEEKKVYWFLIPCILMQGILIYFYHTSIFDVIKINIFVCIIILVLLLMFILPKMNINGKKSKD